MDMLDQGTLLSSVFTGEPDRPALISPGGPVVTYRSLRTQVERLATWLQRAGICRGDRVALALPNGIEAVIAFMAAATAATSAPLNPRYTPEEIQYFMADTGAKALIVPAFGTKLALAARERGIVLIESSIDSEGSVEFVTSARVRALGELAPALPQDVALVLHTSGTTSRPKRVPLRHANLVVSARNIAESYGLQTADVALCVMPLFHVHGLVGSALSSLQVGAAVVVPPAFNALAFWPAVREHGATWYSAVPAMHQMLLARARANTRPPGADHLRFIRSCSSALAPATMAELESRFGVPVLEAYGMTEASHQIATNPLPPAVRKSGTVGLGFHTAIGIMDPEGRMIPSGSQGEVAVCGAGVISGYEDNPEADAKSFVHGWFRTGDEGILDGQGYLKLVGRIKELVVRGGEKIAPLEVDQVLELHPAVAEAVSFGVPDRIYGEEIEAAAVLRAPATEKELIAFCRDRLADFKCPKRIRIVQRIPRTDTGKIQRSSIAQALAR
jgi:acyl-CoA synthetase (AMP-forming)/AMP-acid ligase II